jgi:16S rRNA G966 N2-methylase RsmD
LTLEITPQQPPSNKLVILIEEFADNAIKAIEIFEEIKRQAYLEGFSGYDLKLLLRFHLKKRMAASTLRWYLSMLEDSTSQNRQLSDIDDKILPEDIVLINDDFRNVQIPKSSVSLIFTDPPYDLQSLEVYKDLAKMADDVLEEGGSLVTYAGQYALPRIFDYILENSQDLCYWWMLCIRHTGKSSQMFQKNVIVQWKPLLWFVKGKNLRADLPGIVEDLIESETPDKEFHEWAQSVKEAEYVITKLTHPGETVVDPFMGSATTGIVALEQKRKFTGIELDTNNFASAKARLEKSVQELIK